MSALAAAALAAGTVLFLRWWATPKLNNSEFQRRTSVASQIGVGPGASDVRGGCGPAPGQAPVPEPVETTLCQVVTQPEAFACKRVRFRASVLSDCLHGTILVDNQCERGIALRAAQGVENHEDMGALERALCAPGPTGTIDRERKVVATFAGRFVWQPHLQLGSRALEAESIERMAITPPLAMP